MNVVLEWLARYARILTSRQDLALVALLMMIIFMIIIPLPTWLIDILIGLNLSLVILVLISTVYLERPTAFSTLPSILLFSTLFRLAISIATTRMILVQADAGAIVQTFGEFVLAGSVVVGLVVFLIITIVQFVVITKGSERVAEVGARFSLDALPGKQMSIDSDMRAGEIDIAEARRRRANLSLESEFYGSMDGAMKFVKGDAIAGLIIIVVNLIGGISVGVGQLGMAFGEATLKYSVLTVGDGLVSQIPALLMAIASGIVITRIMSEESSDLGQDIAGQMGASPRALKVAALVMVLFACIPGFPAFVFIGLALFFAGMGFLASSDLKGEEKNSAAATGAELRNDLLMAPMAPVHVIVGEKLMAAIDPVQFRAAVVMERKRLFDQIGVPFPPIMLMTASDVPQKAWRLIIEGVPVAEGELPTDALRLIDDHELGAISGLSPYEYTLSPTGVRSYWIDAALTSAVKKSGLAVESVEAVLVNIIAQMLPRHASEFLGIHETSAILAAMEKRYSDLVAEAQKTIPLQKIAQIMRRLVEDEVPIRNMRILLETIVEWGSREKDPDLLAEYVRIALARQISHQYSDSDSFIAAYVIESDIEDLVRNSLRQSTAGTFLSLEPEQSRNIINSIRRAVGDMSMHGSVPVILASMDVRRHLRKFLMEHDVTFPVLSHKEIAPQYKVQPLAMVTLR